MGAGLKDKIRILAIASGGFVLVCGLFEWRTLAGGGAWWLSPVLTALCALVILPFMFTSFMPVFGSTLLTGTGVELRLLWRRRRVPWSEIATVEAQRRTGRGGSWYVARLRTVPGRRHVLRGLVGESSDTPSNSFWADLERVRSAWEQATGRTEPVQKI